MNQKEINLMCARMQAKLPPFPPKVIVKPWERVALWCVYGVIIWATFECAKMLYDLRYHPKYQTQDPFKHQPK